MISRIRFLENEYKKMKVKCHDTEKILSKMYISYNKCTSYNGYLNDDVTLEYASYLK